MTLLADPKLLPLDLEWIYFDLDDTLWSHVDARNHAVGAICRLLALDSAAFTDHYKRETTLLIQQINEGRMDVATSRVVRMKNILHVMGVRAEAQEVERIAQQYLDEYVAYQGTIESAREVIAAASRIARLGILTNAAHETQDPKIAQLGGPNMFDLIVTTDETKEILKPDPRFFEYADRIAGNPDPSRVLMIGDDWKHDICGACERGYWSIWISQEEQLPECRDRVFRISSLKELHRVLEEMSDSRLLQ